MWATDSGVSFKIVKRQPTANVYIAFIPSVPGDPGDFGVLALAESPTPFRKPPSSTIHFDTREQWVDKWRPEQDSKFSLYSTTISLVCRLVSVVISKHYEICKHYLLTSRYMVE